MPSVPVAEFKGEQIELRMGTLQLGYSLRNQCHDSCNGGCNRCDCVEDSCRRFYCPDHSVNLRLLLVDGLRGLTDHADGSFEAFDRLDSQQTGQPFLQGVRIQ